MQCNNFQYVVYGAYDRHNYGDLLFALVVREYIVRIAGVEPIIASTKDSDLGSYGALKTIALSKALRFPMEKCVERRLIVAGGEVLTARWESILGYLAPPVFYYPIKIVPYLIGYPLFSKISQWVTGIPAPMPFVPPSSVSASTKVYYNAVGGSAISKNSKAIKRYIKESLTSASYVSVRDEKTSAALKDLGVSSVLSPDCALLMSEMYPREDLLSRATLGFDAFIKGQGEFVVFHISQHHAKGRVQQIASELKKVFSSTGLRIALLSIGKAPGHSDDIPLDEIHKILPEESFRVSSGHVFDVMATIAHSKIYCGTSLHGAITAMAYGVPHIGLLPEEVTKLSAFLRAWSTEGYSDCLDVDGVSNGIIQLIGRATNAVEVERFQKRVADLSFAVKENFSKLIEPFVSLS